MRKRRHRKTSATLKNYYKRSQDLSSLIDKDKNISIVQKINLSTNNNPVRSKTYFNNEDNSLDFVRKRRKSIISCASSKKLRSNSYNHCSEIEEIAVLSNKQLFVTRDNVEKDSDNSSLADTVIGELTDDGLTAFEDEIKIDDTISEIDIKRKPNSLIQSFSCVETTVNSSLDKELFPIISKYSNISDDSSSSLTSSCIICLSKPKNAVFVHSKFVHLCSCYKCAVKIFNRSKLCPICNCAVKTVLQVFAH